MFVNSPSNLPGNDIFRYVSKKYLDPAAPAVLREKKRTLNKNKNISKRQTQLKKMANAKMAEQFSIQLYPTNADKVLSTKVSLSKIGKLKEVVGPAHACSKLNYQPAGKEC